MPGRSKTRRRTRRSNGRKSNRSAEDVRERLHSPHDRVPGLGMDGLLDLLDEYPGTRRDGLGRLLVGIAAAELSLARFINVESEKSECVARRIATPFSPEELIEYEKALASVVSEIVKKEQILLQKLRLVLSYIGEFEEDEACDDDKFDECDEMDDYGEKMDGDL